nr:nuclease SbcCD subunit C-like [Aegilops tauschii subsp. strangulata]
MREVLLNAIRHPYDQARTQVVRVASEEPEANGREEEATADAGAGRRAGKSCVYFLSRRSRDGLERLTQVVVAAVPGGGGGGVAGAGSSRGAPAASRPHGKDNVASRAPAVRRAADPIGGAKPAAKRRHGAPQERAARPVVPVVPGSPISLALAAADAASVEGATFWRSRSGTVDQDEEEEEWADPDLGLDLANAEGLAWRDRNRAEAELEAASTQAWVSTATTWARAGEEPAWPEMPARTVAAATVFVLSLEGEHNQGGRADVMDLDWEVVVIGDDTPPRTDVVERAGADGGYSGRRTGDGAGEGAGEGADRRGEASGEHALVLRSGGRQVAGSQPTRSGTGEVFFGPPTQEEAAMAAVTRRLRGRTDWIQAFAQAEVEATQELECAVFQLDFYRVSVFNRLLETHRRLKEQLVAKKEELRAAAAEVLSWRTRLIRAGFHYDRLVVDTGRLGTEVERVRAEATGAPRALDEASQLREQLAGDKGRLEAEVERLKAEAAKVVEAVTPTMRGLLGERQLAEEAVRFQRDPQGIVGSGTDPRVAWTFSEIVTAAEAHLRVLSEQMGRLSEAGAAMTAALWLGSVTPNSFTRMARWLEVGPDHLHE